MESLKLANGLPEKNQSEPQNKRRLSLVLTTLVLLLSGLPKLRIVVGFPLYAVDVIIAYLLIQTWYLERPHYEGNARLITQLIVGYAFFMVLGELNGAWVYGNYADSIYLLARSILAISLVGIISRQVQNIDALKLLLKGLCIGLLISGILSILYSFASTRGLTHFIFSIKMIAPDGDQILRGNSVYDAVYSGDYRGRNLIGTSTFASGVMALLWPLVFMANHLLKSNKILRVVARIALVIVPLGILVTYGRTAWLSVILVSIFVLVQGFHKGKLMVPLCLLITFLLLGNFNFSEITSHLPLLDRVVSKTQMTVESGAEHESESERFLAYVEPFDHVARYPSFLLAGTGIAQRKFGGNTYEEATTASHAIPAMAYYSYGVGGALCQVGLMLSTLKLVYERLQDAKNSLSKMLWMWRSLFAAWIGLFPWWCFAHGIVSQPRGAMVFFLYIGLLLACDNIYRQSKDKQMQQYLFLEHEQV